LDEMAIEAGLQLPLPVVNESGPDKPDLTPEQVARVEAIYADDIALHNSITEVGQVYVAPPVLATEEDKVLKRMELEQIRKAAYQGDLMTSFGIPFKTDVMTILDIQAIIEALPAGGVYPGYKCADGVRRDITKEQFQQGFAEGFQRKSQAFATETAKLEAVDAAVTLADLDAI
jgi:hypothetical protein